MAINHNLIEATVKNHNSRRNRYIKSRSDISNLEAAMIFDCSQKLTTNRIQLEFVGVDCSDVSKNYEEIVEALRLLGITIIDERVTRDVAVKHITCAIEEEVTECWRNEGMQEVIELK